MRHAITLTEVKGTSIRVNFDHVMNYKNQETGKTIIRFKTNDVVYVLENCDQINALLEQRLVDYISACERATQDIIKQYNPVFQ